MRNGLRNCEAEEEELKGERTLILQEIKRERERVVDGWMEGGREVVLLGEKEKPLLQ